MGTFKTFTTVTGQEIEVNLSEEECKKNFDCLPGDRFRMPGGVFGTVVGTAPCVCGCKDPKQRLWVREDGKEALANCVKANSMIFFTRNGLSCLLEKNFLFIGKVGEDKYAILRSPKMPDPFNASFYSDISIDDFLPRLAKIAADSKRTYALINGISADKLRSVFQAEMEPFSPVSAEMFLMALETISENDF